MKTHENATPRPWDHACDGYGTRETGKATPRPWTLGENIGGGVNQIYSAKGDCVADASDRSSSIKSDEERAANAALIVEAVNAHDHVRELVETAWAGYAVWGKLHDGLSDMVEEGRLKENDFPDDYLWLVETLAGSSDVINRLRAALAKLTPAGD